MQLGGGAAGVQLGPSAPGGAFVAGGHDEGGRGEDLAAEVGGVQLDPPDGFVDAAEVGDRERLFEECGGQAGVFEFGSGAVDGLGEDAVVVEGERRELGEREPAHLVSVVGRRADDVRSER